MVFFSEKWSALVATSALTLLTVAPASISKVFAQPVATPAKTGAAPTPPVTSARDKAEMARVLGLLAQEELCKSPISVKVQNATLAQLVEQVKAALPDTQRIKANIELRQAGEPDNDPIASARFSFGLKETSLGSILQSAAGLTGCKFLILPDRLLITQGQQATAEEQSQARSWAQNVASSGQGWSMAPEASGLMTRLVVAELQARAVTGEPNIPTTTMRFDQLQPELQQLMQSSVDDKSHKAGHSTMQVPSNALVVLGEVNPSTVQFTLILHSYGREYRWMSLSDSSQRSGRIMTIAPKLSRN